MHFLIAGLGNIGSDYEHTRHNIGFMVADLLADRHGVSFSDQRYGALAEYRLKNKLVTLLKPNTYMNLSGKAIRYWMQQKSVQTDQLLVITDDISLPEGKLRLKPKGSDGGHNGLKNIQELLGTNQYPRLRFGVGNDFAKGAQVQYVLSKWTAEELKALQPRVELAADITESFVLAGIQRAMNDFNNR